MGMFEEEEKKMAEEAAAANQREEQHRTELNEVAHHVGEDLWGYLGTHRGSHTIDVNVVHRPWRRVKVTDSRTAVDFAACMRELVDVHFPKAERIRVVLDNLSTHTAGALYQAFPPAEARRLLNRLEFHYVPKHASWLNMVEIEIGVLRSQCLDRRIDSKERLVSEIAAWERQRNASRARIKWMFTTEKARTKMGRAYPKLSTKESKSL
jgi:DDE superfamily endonuclease